MNNSVFIMYTTCSLQYLFLILCKEIQQGQNRLLICAHPHDVVTNLASFRDGSRISVGERAPSPHSDTFQSDAPFPFHQCHIVCEKIVNNSRNAAKLWEKFSDSHRIFKHFILL